MSVGKSVRLFLADGTPGGLLTAEIMNWTGHVIAAPRSDLGALTKRPETSRTGVYILLGDDPDDPGRDAAYIGEGDDVGKRLYMHSRPEAQGGKDFWNRAIVLTSKDTNLTKAHARYLESRFISIAAEAGRARLVNGTTPPAIPLPESDISDMEYFIAQARIVLPVLGINLLRVPSVAPVSSSTSNELVSGRTDAQASPVFQMEVRRHGLIATAQEVDGEFTVHKGSHARLEWSAPEHNYRKLRERLEQDGTLAPSADGNYMIFTHDQVFSSPSAAGAMVKGHAANGRTDWKIKGTQVAYGEWENRGLDLSVKDY